MKANMKVCFHTFIFALIHIQSYAHLYLTVYLSYCALLYTQSIQKVYTRYTAMYESDVEE